jgi:hypothetical protein
VIVPLDLRGRLHLNPLADLSVHRSFALNSLVRSPSVSVSSRVNAAGEQAMVRTRGKFQSTKVELNFCSDEDEAWLELYQGEPLLFRTDLGLTGDRFWGYYTDSTFTPRFIRNSWAVPLTVVEVSIDESV